MHQPPIGDFGPVEPQFLKILQRVAPYSMVGLYRMYSLYGAIRYIIANDIPGDFVECGVYRGGSCMMMALTLMSLGVTDRRIYLYDTFRGMSEPGAADISMKRDRVGVTEWREKQAEDHNEWCFAALDEVQQNMTSTGYDVNQLRYVEGRTQDTLPDTLPGDIALLRLDTDWYDSTYHELTHLYPRLVKNGVFISDDYAHWRGHRLAIDNYFQVNSINLMLNRTACGAIAINCP